MGKGVSRRGVKCTEEMACCRVAAGDSGTGAATSGHAAGGDTPGLDRCGLVPRTEWHKEWHTAS